MPIYILHNAASQCCILGNLHTKLLTSSLFTSRSENSMAGSDQHKTSPDLPIRCHDL